MLSAGVAGSGQLNEPTSAGHRFSALRRAIDTSPRVREALDETIETVARPGAFGLDYDAIGDVAERLDTVLDGEPATLQRMAFLMACPIQNTKCICV